MESKITETDAYEKALTHMEKYLQTRFRYLKHTVFSLMGFLMVLQMILLWFGPEDMFSTIQIVSILLYVSMGVFFWLGVNSALAKKFSEYKDKIVHGNIQKETIDDLKAKFSFYSQQNILLMLLFYFLGLILILQRILTGGLCGTSFLEIASVIFVLGFLWVWLPLIKFHIGKTYGPIIDYISIRKEIENNSNLE